MKNKKLSRKAAVERLQGFFRQYPNIAEGLGIPKTVDGTLGHISELTQQEVYCAIATTLGGQHVISAYTKQTECDRMRRWYEKLTNRRGKYRTVNIPFNMPIPPESEWPSIKKAATPERKTA